HFLKGSLQIGLKRFVGAHHSLSAAVALAPEFHLARFQLGFFELTSGEAAAASDTWAPLFAVLEPDHWMRRFVEGLEHLAADRFADCIHCLRAGIAANQENAPLNADMALVIAKCEEQLGTGPSESGGANTADADEISPEISATSFLLGNRARRH